MAIDNVLRVSPAMLVPILKKITRAQPVGLIARTIPEMRRRENPFHLGEGVFDVVRVRQLTGFIGFDYTRCVNRQRRREEKPEGFESQGRDWGQRVWTGKRRNAGSGTAKRTSLIRHGSKWYLDMKRQTVVKTEHRRISTNELIDDGDLKPFVRPDDGESERKRQGVERPVIIRDYAIKNVAQLTIAGTLYVMDPCPNTSLDYSEPFSLAAA